MSDVDPITSEILDAHKLIQDKVKAIVHEYNKQRYRSSPDKLTFEILWEPNQVRVVQWLGYTDGYDELFFPIEWITSGDWKEQLVQFVSDILAKEYETRRKRDFATWERLNTEFGTTPCVCKKKESSVQS